MEKTIYAANGTTLKIPKDADKIRVQKTQREISVVWEWSV